MKQSPRTMERADHGPSSARPIVITAAVAMVGCLIAGVGAIVEVSTQDTAQAQAGQSTAGAAEPAGGTVSFEGVTLQVPGDWALRRVVAAGSDTTLKQACVGPQTAPAPGCVVWIYRDSTPGALETSTPPGTISPASCPGIVTYRADNSWERPDAAATAWQYTDWQCIDSPQTRTRVWLLPERGIALVEKSADGANQDAAADVVVRSIKISS